jgi:hypothetical protein
MSKRTVSVERLYSLGDFKNIKFTESQEIDDEISETEIDKIRFLQIIDIEIRHKWYLKLFVEGIKEIETLDDKLEYLKELKLGILENKTGEN